MSAGIGRRVDRLDQPSRRKCSVNYRTSAYLPDVHHVKTLCFVAVKIP